MKITIKIFKISIFLSIFIAVAYVVLWVKNKELWNDILEEKNYIPDDDDIYKFGNEARFLKAHRLSRRNASEAKKAFEMVMCESKEMKAYASYNVANILMEEAIKERKVYLFEMAIDSYKLALREKPDFWLAKYNLELAKKLLQKSQIVVPPTKYENRGKGFYPDVPKDI